MKISQNKDMSRFSPIRKQQKIEENSQSLRFSSAVVRITRNNIIEMKKLEKESKLKLKNSRLEIRMKKGVITKKMMNDVKSAWILLTISCSLASSFHSFLLSKKILKHRVSTMTRKLRIFSRVIGKLNIMLYRYKKQSNLQRIYQTITKKSKTLLISTKIMRALLSSFLERSLGLMVISKAIHSIHIKIQKAQKNVRFFLLYRQNLYISLLRHWSSIEKTFQKRTGRGRRSIIQPTKALSDISKIFMIRSFINAKIKESIRQQAAGVSLQSILVQEFHLDPSFFTFNYIST